MKSKILLLLLLLFALFAVLFAVPKWMERREEQVLPSATGTAESPAETMEESSFPYETAWAESGTETESAPFEEEDPGEPVEREKIQTDIMFASDIHYLSPKLTDYGDAFAEMSGNDDGKVEKYMTQIWQAFAEEVISARPDALVLSGDLTLDGEKVNHQELAARLAEIEANGIPVLVIPGNHDINNPRAAAYFGEEETEAEAVTPEEFREIYRPYGYEEAVSYAPDSMSYLYRLNDTTWMMMLDTCIYEPENRVYGDIKPKTLNWMEECLKEAYAQGITVIPVGHHNLQELSRVYVEECVLENHEEVIRVLEKYLTPVYMSGHLHVQRILKHLREPGVGDDVYGIWEIVSNSLIIPPCQYGTLSCAPDGTFAYHTHNVNVSSWAAKHGETNTDLLDFPAFSDEYLRMIVRQQAYEEIDGIPDELREELADFYAELYRDYYAGRQINYKERQKERGYQLWDRFMNPSMQFRQVEGMMKDGMAVNNNAEIPNPLHLTRPWL